MFFCQFLKLHSITISLLTIKLTVQTFSSLAKSKTSPYQTKLFVKYCSTVVLDILYLFPKISIYQISKFESLIRFEFT